MKNEFMLRLNLNLAISVILGVTLSTGCTDSELPTASPAQTSGVDEAAISPSSKPLSPVMESAMECFKKCVEVSYDRNAGSSDPLLPHEFEELLRSKPALEERFLELVKQLPNNYWSIAIRPTNLPETVNRSGWTIYVMRSGNDLVQIYANIGFPNRTKPSDADYRPPGSLALAINISQNTIALVFHGQSDLSEYRFSGDKDLQGKLVAYLAAEETLVEKAYLVSQTEPSEPVIFPIPEDRITPAVARLTYLNEHFSNGEIHSVRSAYDAGNKARRPSPDKIWWAARISSSECMETAGPSEVIEQYGKVGERVVTTDFRDGMGNIYKVEARTPAVGGTVEVWTYFKSKAKCEDESYRAVAAQANRYR